MKKILTVATGGTIGSSLIGGCRRLNSGVATSILLQSFKNSTSAFAEAERLCFVDSNFENKTLSENMTLKRLFSIYTHIRDMDKSGYSGMIVLHGTDTLAFTAAFLSAALSNIDLPLVLVSGNRPPDMKESNANANFRAAAELICEGLPAGVYAAYQNSDKRIYLHLGKSLMQCENYSDDFRNAEAENCFVLDGDNRLSAKDLERLASLSSRRNGKWGEIAARMTEPRGEVLLLKPYVGLDYSRIDLSGVGAVVHGSYHSGTVCACGADSPYSVTALAKRCTEQGIPLYVAPCVLNEDQYESAYEAKKGGVIPLDMTVELAYTRLLIALWANLDNEKITEIMKDE